MPELLNRHQAARYLRVGARTLDRWRAEARNIPYMKYAHGVYYRREDLDAFLNQMTRKVAC